MFNGCSSLKSIDLSNFDFSLFNNVTILDGCSQLESIKFSDEFNSNHLLNHIFSLPRVNH